MKKSYQIADLSIGGNIIRVTAIVEDDGGLTIYDLSYGPSADLFYGAGREVEYWLKIPPDSAKQLSMHLLGKLADDPVDEVAQFLASMYVDDNYARSKIQKTLDENQIQYEPMCWH